MSTGRNVPLGHVTSPRQKNSIPETFAEIYLKELSTDIDKKAFLH
jgi:hypothetical protein